MNKKTGCKIVAVVIVLFMILGGCAYRGEFPKSAKAVRNITKTLYDNSGILALNNEDGRAFTDHKQGHVEMVAEKSLEVADSVTKAVNGGTFGNSRGDGRIAFSANIDRKRLEGAALSHDTGMAGGGYALSPLMGDNGKQLKDDFGRKMFEKDENGKYLVHPEDNSNFGEVRDNHSLNSAINVLINRDEYIKAGFSSEEVDIIASECMAHSKSGSGVSDLNRKSDWSDSYDRIDATVSAYNEDHPDAQIFFDRNVIEGDDDVFAAMVSESFAIRIGDVSRDSWPDAEAQSGETVHVDRLTINNQAGSIEGEIENIVITIGDKGDLVTNAKSKQVHAGEQNIIKNRTYVGSNGRLVHEITVNDGSSAPACTQEAINDHLGEFKCVPDEMFDVSIVFKKDCDDFSKELYEQFRDIAAGEYDNIDIIYPWDKE